MIAAPSPRRLRARVAVGGVVTALAFLSAGAAAGVGAGAGTGATLQSGRASAATPSPTGSRTPSPSPSASPSASPSPTPTATPAANTLDLDGTQDGSGRFVAGAPLVMSGTWQHEDGVREVRIFVYDIGRKLWRTASGTWQAGGTYARATLTAPGETSTGYTSAPIVLGEGSYRVIAKGVTATGVLGTPVGRQISVVAAATPAYLTIMFGRSAWAPSSHCVVVPGAKTLEDAMVFLKDRGMIGVGGVVLDRTQEESRYCNGDRIVYPSWEDLARLRDEYGAVMISQSKTYEHWLDLSTAEEFEEETCATLEPLVAHGHDRAWGMFNFPDDNVFPNGNAIPVAQVNGCFAFGRKYAPLGAVNPVDSLNKAPYLVRTNSITSGACNNTALACYKLVTKNNRRYILPGALARAMAPKPGEYSVVQFYRFVSGAQKVGSLSWDCTSKDPRDHWSNTPEVYCFDDFKAAVALVPSSVVVTDPATVAAAVGRLPGS